MYNCIHILMYKYLYMCVYIYIYMYCRDATASEMSAEESLRAEVGRAASSSAGFEQQREGSPLPWQGSVAAVCRKMDIY